jgi:hypothetical protein
MKFVMNTVHGEGGDDSAECICCRFTISTHAHNAHWSLYLYTYIESSNIFQIFLEKIEMSKFHLYNLI